MQEMVKIYHKSGGAPRCAMKLDLMKAYDPVAWKLLFDTLVVAEFPAPFIRWTKQYVTKAMFSIVINSELEGCFPGKRGLRQGDPLSSNLLLLVMEAFTYSITELVIWSLALPNFC